MVRWIAVLPAAILAWLAVDMLGPLPLNALVWLGTLVRLSPLAELLFSPAQGGEHLLVLASYAAAVLAAWGTAPNRKELAALGVGALFLLLRFGMTFSVMSGGSITADSPGRFAFGTLAAVVGVVAGLLWTRRAGSGDGSQKL